MNKNLTELESKDLKSEFLTCKVSMKIFNNIGAKKRTLENYLEFLDLVIYINKNSAFKSAIDKNQ